MCKKAYENGEKHPTVIDLHKKLVKEVKSIYDWYYEVSKCAPQEALRNLAKAYQWFFKGQAKHPVFQKKGRKDSFYLEGNRVYHDSFCKSELSKSLKLLES